MNKVSASILSADFGSLEAEIKKCEEAGADMIHVDVMDGHFVPVITIGDIIVKTVRPLTQLPIEAHLMIENPGSQIERFADAGADIISLHQECYGMRKPECREFGQFPKENETFDSDEALEDINKIKSFGKKAYMVVNPGSDIMLDEVLEVIDGVLIMSVNPGFAGQKFIPSVLPKVVALREKFKGDIAIDGGVNAQTAPEAVKAGVNILATASYLFGADDPKKEVDFLKNL